MATDDEPSCAVGVVVAHPDDETLWAGGTVLLHPRWRCTVFALCRASDSDRAPKFHRALERLGACGRMADLDDGEQQSPLPGASVRRTVLDLLGTAEFDLLLTHAPQGEYTRHRRHSETFNAVWDLWRAGAIRAVQLWLFAYEDGGGAYLPRAAERADVRIALPEGVWGEKCRIMREVYRFAPDSWEARAAPRVEAFWRFPSAQDLAAWLEGNEGLR